MMKNFLISIVIFLFSCNVFATASYNFLQQQWLLQKQELRVGILEQEFPPYFNFNNGYDSGIFSFYLNQLQMSAAVNLKFIRFKTSSSLAEALAKGEVDLSPEIKDTQLNTLLFSNSFSTSIAGLLLKDSVSNTEIEDLYKGKNLKWGCIEASLYCEALNNKDIPTVDNMTIDDAIFNLKTGKIDALLGDYANLAELMAINKITNARLLHPTWVKEDDFKFAISPNNQILLDIINSFIKSSQKTNLSSSYNAAVQLDEYYKNTNTFAIIKDKYPIVNYYLPTNLFPLSFINEQGHVSGVLVDLFKLLSERGNINFNNISSDLSNKTNITKLLDTKEIDFLPIFDKDMEAYKDKLILSPPITQVEFVLLSLKTTPNVVYLKQLSNKKIGMVVDNKIISDVKEIKIIKLVDNNLDYFMDMLNAGTLSYVYLPKITAAMYMKKSSNLKVNYTHPDLVHDVRLGINKKSEELFRPIYLLTSSLTKYEQNIFLKKYITKQDFLQPQTGIFALISFLAVALLITIYYFLKYKRKLKKVYLIKDNLVDQLNLQKQLIDVLPNMVVVQDEHGRQIFSNDEYKKNLSFLWDKDTFRKSTLTDHILKRNLIVWNTGEELQSNISVPLPTGGVIDLVYKKKLYLDKHKNKLGIITSLTDTTLFNSLKDATKQAQVAIAHITNALPGGVFQYIYKSSTKANFSYLSDGCLMLLNTTIAESINNDTFIPTGAISSDFDSLKEKIKFHSKNLTPLNFDLKLTTDEVDTWVKFIANPIQTDTEVQWNGIMLDITNVKQQQVALQKAITYAQNASESRSRFLATMSHELRTPIAGIIGMLELLSMGSLDEEQEFLIKSVNGGVLNLLHLLNDILDYSKIEAKQLKLDYQVIDIVNLICEVHRTHASNAKAKGLDVIINWNLHSISTIKTDPFRLSQIISNLLSNAIKFTNKGSIKLDVNLSATELNIKIIDSGIGIASDQQSKLFAPFEQLDASRARNYGGSGLGLSIVKQLTTLLEGSVVLKSEINRGTEVEVTIPVINSALKEPIFLNYNINIADGTKLEPSLDYLQLKYQSITDDELASLESTSKSNVLIIISKEKLEKIFGVNWLSIINSYSVHFLILSMENILIKRTSPNCLELCTNPVYPDLLYQALTMVMVAPVKNSQTAPKKFAGKALIVEDNAVNRALIKRQMSLLGLDLFLAENGFNALELLKEHTFDIILTDCHMPELDGYELTQRVRKIPLTIPIIGITADDTKASDSLCKESGMDDVLHKPYTIEGLQAILTKHLQIKEQEPQEDRSDSCENNSEGASLLEQWQAFFTLPEQAHEMAMLYEESLVDDKIELQAAIDASDHKQIKEIVHRIKGAAGMVKSEAVYLQAVSVDAKLKDGATLADITSDLQLLLTNIDNTKEQMQTWSF